MVLADWQAGRRVNKPGQARSHRQEHEEGRMAEGQAAQKNVRNLFFPGRTRPGGVPGQAEFQRLLLSRSPPLLRTPDFWKVFALKMRIRLLRILS